MDDEADSDGADDDEETLEDLDSDLEGFIDDSEEVSEPNFDLRKKVEIELNGIALLKFLETQEPSVLNAIGLSFVYSRAKDLVK